MSFNSPPQAGRRQFHQRAVRVAHIKAHPPSRPAILANDIHAGVGETLAPGLEIIGADRKCEVQAPAAVVPWNRAACVDNVLLSRAGLEHQQAAALSYLERDKPRRVDKRLQSKQMAIKLRGALKIARVERCFQEG